MNFQDTFYQKAIWKKSENVWKGKELTHHTNELPIKNKQSNHNKKTNKQTTNYQQHHGEKLNERNSTKTMTIRVNAWMSGPILGSFNRFCKVVVIVMDISQR